jgi:hypothetical protein
MTDTTPRSGLPLLAAAQAQKHVTHNEALLELDALLYARLITRTLSTPPAAPADGDTYLVGVGATGAWSGQDGRIAYAFAGAWRFYIPFAGLTAAVADEDKSIVFDGRTWSDVAAASAQQTLPLLGIGATADATNRLAVKSAAVLLDNIGEGVQLKLNKQAEADTASLLYQTNYSGRAEIGLTGDDDFHIKVSADGATWKSALAIDRRTGTAAFTGPVLFVGGSNLVAGDLVQGHDLSASRTVVTIAGNGNLMNANNSYGAISDARLKQDIADAASQWSDIKALKLRRYRLKRDVARDPAAPFQLGLVAQEAVQTCKHLVTIGAIDDLADAQGIKYSVLHLKSLGALQEAMARIEALEARIGER